MSWSGCREGIISSVHFTSVQSQERGRDQPNQPRHEEGSHDTPSHTKSGSVSEAWGKEGPEAAETKIQPAAFKSTEPAGAPPVPNSSLIREAMSICTRGLDPGGEGGGGEPGAFVLGLLGHLPPTCGAPTSVWSHSNIGVIPKRKGRGSIKASLTPEGPGGGQSAGGPRHPPCGRRRGRASPRPPAAPRGSPAAPGTAPPFTKCNISSEPSEATRVSARICSETHEQPATGG